MKDYMYVPQLSATLQRRLTEEEKTELSGVWNEIEAKWNIDVWDVSDSMTMDAELVKEITFKDKPGSKPRYIRLDWDNIMYDEDGNELSDAELEKKAAKDVDEILEFSDEDECEDKDNQI